MSGKKITQLKRKIKQYEGDIKIEGLRQWEEFANMQPLYKRFRLALRILFKRM